MTKQIINAIITDCFDENSRLRLSVEASKLFGVQPIIAGVESELEAAGCLVDALDRLAAVKQRTVVLVNAAPRGDHAADPEWNGTPFGYVEVGQTLIVSTFGQSLSLVKKLGLASRIHLLDVKTVVEVAVGWGELLPADADVIKNSQFRSLEFQPLVAKWLVEGRKVPVAETRDIPALDGDVWYVDRFGNAKLTLLSDDIRYVPGETIELTDGERVQCIPRLADVPKDQPALTIGSSGFGERKFLELVSSGLGVNHFPHIKVGDTVFTDDVRYN